MTTGIPEPGDDTEDGLPLSRFAWIPKPAAKAAVQSAYASGMKAGLPDDIALTLAEAAMDPAQLRAELNNPKQRHIDGCTITYVTVDVWAPAVIPSLENVRFEHERGHWLATPEQTLLPRYGSAHDSPALTLSANDPDHVVGVVSGLVEKALVANHQVQTIPLRGVEEPVMLAVARVAFRNGEQVTVLDPIDGFCRVAKTHHTMGVTLFDALITYNNKPSMRGTLIKDILETGRRSEPAGDDTEDLARQKAEARSKLRSLVLQKAMVIIGFDGQGHVSFDQARRRLVGRLHLSPPHEFTAEATHGAKGRAVVESLTDHARLPDVTGLNDSQVAYALLGDATTPVPDEGAPDLSPDEISALALRALRPRSEPARRDVDFAIRDLTGHRPTAAECQNVAAELALRAAPGISATVAQRAALARAWQIGAFTDSGWTVTRRPVEALLKQSRMELDQLRRSGSKVGPAMTELAALASWYLVTADPHPLARSGFGTKRSARTGKDNREPNTLLRAMMQDPDGLRQLAQVVYDGRAGRSLTVLPQGARPVDQHRADARRLDEAALRESVITPGTTTGSSDPDRHRIPEQDWTDAQEAVQSSAAELDRATRELLKTRRADGATFASTLGYADEDVMRQVEASTKRLNGLDFQRTLYLESLRNTPEDEEGDER